MDLDARPALADPSPQLNRYTCRGNNWYTRDGLPLEVQDRLRSGAPTSNSNGSLPQAADQNTPSPRDPIHYLMPAIGWWVDVATELVETTRRWPNRPYRNCKQSTCRDELVGNLTSLNKLAQKLFHWPKKKLHYWNGAATQISSKIMALCKIMALLRGARTRAISE